MPKNPGNSLRAAVAVIALSPFFAAGAFAQVAPNVRSGPSDPGVRGGPPGAGCFLTGLDGTEQTFFFAAGGRFGEVDSVSNTINDAGSAPGLPPNSGTATGNITFCPGTSHAMTQARQNGSGLGPRFNENSCAACHAQPAVGGSSPASNPQLQVAQLDGADNTVPSFIAATGPVREARFIKNSNGTPDGGVHDLFVVTKRTDASGCNITQPNFAQAVQQSNIIFRIPTPTFGAGLVENVPDGNLVTDSVNISGPQASLGIASGVFNVSGNDGTITRFGWKAQNKSLLIFAGEAYNVEQGVTNDAFPNERDDTAGCRFNPLPEDATNLTDPNTSGFAPSDFSSDIVNFAAFMRLSAGPTPAPTTNTTVQGFNQFVNVGCADCHMQHHTTGSSIFTGQSNVQFTPFSDFALHDMGTGLQDQVSQGAADGQQFRTAPLWGVGQRVFFLHDGRTNSLVTAIQAHSSSGSEANQVIAQFNKLSASDQQAVILFLRSL
jgi:CxxC motif-containing protein (DUF1111 family)